MSLTVRLLGDAAVLDERGVPLAFSGRRTPLALLSHLASAAPALRSRERVVDLLWPDASEKTARNRLTSTLYQVRQALGADVLVSVGDGLRYSGAALPCDVVLFQEALRSGDLDRAVDLYTGPFLEGSRLHRSVQFEQWVDGERLRLRSAFHAALEELAARAEAEDCPADAALWWRRRADSDPFDTRVATRLVEALVAAGRDREALRAAQDHEAELAAELECAPEPAFVALTDRLRAGKQARTRTPGLTQPPVSRSVAVLPLRAVGTSECEQYAAAVREGILNQLGSAVGLRVISRQSVDALGGRPGSARRLAADLDVGWVVEGTVRASRTTLRVDVRLVDAREDRQAWQQDFVGPLSTAALHRLQSDIARRIAETMGAPEAEDFWPADRPPTGSLEAYRTWAEGRMHLDQRSADAMERAVDAFERAVELDPGYALAWVGLADALGLLQAYGFVDAEEALPRAEAAILQALDLDPGCAEAHAAMGRLEGQRCFATAADRALRWAVQLKPNYAEAHSWLTVGHHISGRRLEALDSARRAVLLNPLSAEATYNLGMSYLINGEGEAALAEARRTRDLAHSYDSGRLLEGLVLYELGRYAAAAEVLDGLHVPWAGSAPTAVRALALVAIDRAEAEALLSDLEDHGNPFDVGLVRAALGDRERAFRMFAEIPFGGELWHLTYWPTVSMRYLFGDLWNGIRTDERYDALWRRVQDIWVPGSSVLETTEDDRRVAS